MSRVDRGCMRGKRGRGQRGSMRPTPEVIERSMAYYQKHQQQRTVLPEESEPEISEMIQKKQNLWRTNFHYMKLVQTSAEVDAEPQQDQWKRLCGPKGDKRGSRSYKGGRTGGPAHWGWTLTTRQSRFGGYEYPGKPTIAQLKFMWPSFYSTYETQPMFNPFSVE